jgi:protein O-mannosyl-transferase
VTLKRDPDVLRVTAGLVLLGLLLFAGSFNDPFHFDDVLITNDAHVTNPAQWPHFLNPLHLRQVTFFTFYLNHLVGADSPAGYHVVNVVLHILNAVLLFYLLAGLFEKWVAIAAAAVFLAHPVQTEPVLYIYQRSILLACLFSLLALSAIVKRRHWLAIVMFGLAFESKESALAVPLALAFGAVGAVYDRTKTARSQAAPTTQAFPFPILFVPLAVLGLAAAALALLVYRGETTVGIGVGAVGPLQYFLAQTRILYTYLRLLVFPYPQSLEYEFPPTPGFLPLMGIIAILAVAWWLTRTPALRIPGFCVLAFFILLAPTSSIIPSADVAFEHRLYLPMLSFSVLLAYLLSKIPGRTWIGIAVLCILCVMTLRRGATWSSDIALWQDTVKHAPGKARAWMNLGGAYLNVDPDKARAALLRALLLKPNFTEALYDLGVLEQGKGNWSAALTYYQRAVESDPKYWPAWNNMGNTVFSMGERQRSLEYFYETLRLNQDYWPAQYNVAIVKYLSGRYEEALPRLRSVLDWRPDFREARYLLALTLTKTGARKAAGEEWKKLGGFSAAESRNTPAMILAPNRP